ncbi:MAG: response regulator [Treponema sp.]|nr:response regulator [Treponema sp.]
MKTVLVVDASPIFAEFLKDKFASEKIEVHFVQDKFDSIPKMISLFPDLVIVDINESDPLDYILDFLKKVKADPNASRIPMIAAGPLVEKTMIGVYAKLGILKYFMKPIKFDIFFESIGKILQVPFSMDQTPCILELHRNDNIIFIEIARGLNREKLFLLRYKLSEMITQSNLESPKIILMMTDLDLTFVDGLNLELLLNNVISGSRVKNSNIYILSLSSFVRELVYGHPEYTGIQVSTDISQVLNSIVETSSAKQVSDIVTDRILQDSQGRESGSLEMRFSQDVTEEHTPLGKLKEVKKIAILDDDAVIIDLLKNAFSQAGYLCDGYTNPAEFIDYKTYANYSLVIMDMYMPEMTGFDALKKMSEQKNKVPVVIYSQITKREVIIRALQLGAKQYLVKPQKPEVLVNKVGEILNATK